MSELGRREEALAAAREAVMLLAPFFLKLPGRTRGTMSTFLRNYLELSEQAGVEPDAALLTPIFDAFQKLQVPLDAEPSNDV